MSSFPESVLDVDIDLDLGGSWTTVASYAYQREGTTPPIGITRGRANQQAGITPTSVGLQLNNRDGRFSPRNPTGPYYGLLGRNTPLRVSVPAASNYLRFADDAVSYASCPGSASLELSEDIDVRVDMDLDNWAPCLLAGQFSAPSNMYWALSLNGDGTACWTWWDTHTVNQVSSTMPVPLGRVAIRAYFDPAAASGSPQVIFYTAPDMDGTFTQLGNAVAITSGDYAEGSSSADLVVGYSAIWEASTEGAGQYGLQGAVWEVQVYGGSSGTTLEADPKFYDQTAGAGSFTDGQGNTWTLSGTAAISSQNYRAHAECTSLPQRWDPTGTDVYTPVQAKGILRRLQQNSSPLPSTMRRGIKSAASGMGVIAYWPCEDNTGSTQIASGISGGSPMGFIGSPSFQGQAGSPEADEEFACSAQLIQVESSVWSAALPVSAARASSGNLSMLALVYVPSGIPGGNVLVANNSSGGWGIQSDGAGDLEFTCAPSVTVGTYSGAAGVPLLVLMTMVGGTELYAAALPAGKPASEQTVWSAAVTATVATQVLVNYNAALSNNLAATEIGHITFFTGSLPGTIPSGFSTGAITDTAANWAAAWLGETAANRVIRLCGENGISSRVYGYPDLSMAMGQQPIDTLANQFQYCEGADRGLLYEPAETLGIGYRTLGSMCGQTAGVTLNYSAGEIGKSDSDPGLEPIDDDSALLNDETLERNNGSSVEVQVASGPNSIQDPPDGAGEYASQDTVYNAWDADLPRIGGWMTWVGTCDTERYPSIPLNLARPQLADLVDDIIGMRIGDYFTMENLISQMPPGDANQLLYGYTEGLGGFWWTLDVNAVPEDPYDVAVAGACYAESAGTALVAAYSSSAVSLVAATVGIAWVTGSGLSIPILVAGEEMTVTEIGSGPSGSQTSPGTFAELVSVSLPPGTWEVGWTVALSGTVGSADADNFELTTEPGGATVAASVNAGAAGTYAQASALVTISGSLTGVAVKSGGTTPTTGAVYEGTFTSPQTFTVTRSVNGVVKAQAAGAAISIAQPPVAALAGNH